MRSTCQDRPEATDHPATGTGVVEHKLENLRPPVEGIYVVTGHGRQIGGQHQSSRRPSEDRPFR